MRYGYNPCDFDPCLAERRNAEREAAEDMEWAAAESRLRFMGLDPADFDDPIAAVEDLDREADMQEQEEEMLE